MHTTSGPDVANLPPEDELLADGSDSPNLDTEDIIIETPQAPEALVADRNTDYTGPFLKRFRESRSIELKTVSETTKISVSGLKAIEAEAYERLPNARIYVRGYVRCLAQEIGLDPDQVARSYVPRWETWFASQANKKQPYNR